MRLHFLAIAACLVFAWPLAADEPKDTAQGEFSFGVTGVSVSGNEWRFRQYDSPDTGLFATWAMLHLEKPGAATEPVWWDLYGKAKSPTDFETALRWIGQWPLSQVYAYYTGYEFHPETLGIDPETFTFDRAYTSASARRRNAGLGGVFYLGGAPLEFWYGHTTYAGTGAIRGIVYPATPDFNTRDAFLKGGGMLSPTVDWGVVLSQRRFSDGTTLQPDARTRTAKFRIGAGLGGNASLDAEYIRGKVKQTGFSGLDYSHGGLLLDAAWESGLGLQAFITRTSIDNEVTASAYSERVTRSGLKVSYSGIDKVNLRAGADFRSFRQRLTSSATSESDPDRKSYWLSFVARPSRKFSLRAKYETQDACGLTEGRYGSMPDERKRGEAQIRFTPTSRVAFSVSGAREWRDNPREGADYNLATYGATLWAQVTDEVSLFGYYNTYEWDSDSGLLTDWISGADVFGAYVQVAVNERSSASLGYELARSTDSMETTDQSILLGVGWNSGSHSRYSILYRHQQFDEKLFDRNSFRGNVVSANGVFEF